MTMEGREGGCWGGEGLNPNQTNGKRKQKEISESSITQHTTPIADRAEEVSVSSVLQGERKVDK